MDGAACTDISIHAVLADSESDWKSREIQLGGHVQVNQFCTRMRPYVKRTSTYVSCVSGIVTECLVDGAACTDISIQCWLTANLTGNRGEFNLEATFKSINFVHACALCETYVQLRKLRFGGARA